MNTNKKGKNNKAKGEKAQSIVIGHFAKYGIVVALPMSDNLPWDFIAIVKDELYKVQVKSADETRDSDEKRVNFSFRTSNWWKKTTKKYNRKEVDAFIGCDFIDDKVFLFSYKQFENRRSFTIRKDGKRWKKCNDESLFILSEKRINEVFVKE